MTLSPGAHLGPYEIKAPIGAGGMGEVYKAKDTRLGRTVAIKVLAAGAAADPDRRRRFEQEARAVSSLNHPNIGVLYDIGSTSSAQAAGEPGVDFLVMEYIDGHPLSSRIPAGGLPVSELLPIAIQLADAMSSAHERGIVHRDLKPANVMVTDEGRVKVLDFGLARLKPQSPDAAEATMTAATVTAEGRIAGTVSYMSPEQAEGRPVDHRSDIFSLGVMLYEMATGDRPFKGDTTVSVLSAILKDTPRSIRETNPYAPQELERVVTRCLTKDREHRYQSSKDLRNALEEIRRETESGRPAAPSTPTAARLKAARRWRAIAVTVLGTMAVAAGVWWGVNHLLGSTASALGFKERDWILIGDFENTTGDLLFDKSLGTAFSVALSQSKYANVFPRSRLTEVLRRMKKDVDTPVSEQLGAEVCQRENIRALISPSIAKVGSSFVLTARIIDPRTGETVRSLSHNGRNYDEVLPALDQMGVSLRESLGESLAQIRASNLPLAKVTTPSLQALKWYTDGLQLWRKNQYKAALELQTSAVKEDPDFAMAHSALGVYYCSYAFNDLPQGRQHFETALKLTGRLTDREQQVIRLEYESHFGTFEDAVKLYELHLRDYPDSVVQRYNFASNLQQRRNIDQAIEQYQIVLRSAPDHSASVFNLAICYKDKGQLQDALTAFARAFELEPSWLTTDGTNATYGFTLALAGDLAKAREVFLKSATKAASQRSLALLDVWQGKYGDAAAKVQEAIVLNTAGKEKLSEGRNHLYLSMILEGQGKRAASELELDKAAVSLKSVPPVVWLLARVGLTYARHGSTAKAAEVLAIVRKAMNPKNYEDNGQLHLLEGEIELARGNPSGAVERLLLADREYPFALTTEALARAYQGAGQSGDAIASFERLISRPGDYISWEGQQRWLEAHLPLARLYAARQEKDKAQRVLEELLGLWKNADPDLPLLRESIQLSKSLTQAPSARPPA